MPEITIIICAYNASKYIGECLKSVIKQTFRDFEIIIVNDGSTDDTLKICKEFALQDTRIKIFNIKNNGVSHARNFGINRASGKWLTFVDADDWIEVDLLKSLHSYITEGVEIVMGNFFLEYGKRQLQGVCSKTPISKAEFPCYPLALMVPDCACKDRIKVSVEILCAACGKLISRDLLDTYHIRFEEKLALNEDGHFFLRAFLKATDIRIIAKPLYHYRITESSANYRFRPQVHKQMKIWSDAFTLVSQEFPEKFRDEFIALSSYRMYSNLSSLYLNHSENRMRFFQKRRVLKRYLEEPVYQVKKVVNYIKLKKRIEMFALKNKLYTILLLISIIKKFLKKSL